MTPFARILIPYQHSMYPYGISRVAPSVPENGNSLGGSETLDPPDCGRRSGVSPHLPKTLLQLHRNAPVADGIFLPLEGSFSLRAGPLRDCTESDPKSSRARRGEMRVIRGRNGHGLATAGGRGDHLIRAIALDADPAGWRSNDQAISP